MKRLIVLALVAAAPAAWAAPVPGPRPMTCPVGGGSFVYRPPPPAAVSGERPDGKPYTNAVVPPPLPECPANGLVLYKDYDTDEVAKLEPIVASDAYQALRKEDVQYYRAYRLMKDMGLGPDDYLWVLLQASWQADDRPELRARYLTELAEASAKVPPRPDDINWIGMEGRAVNALRELGKFDEAQARLAKVPLKGLDVAAPEPLDASPAAREARLRRAWLAYFKAMKPVLARKDASRDPFDLLPRSVALGRCLDAAGALDEAQKAYCDKESEGVEQLRLARAKADEEMKALQQSREASGR
ncbi:MAG: hypothetical protein QOH04_12 [Sphingomonadales bacterium]|jgi:hypothetical protein|nr:hypothetical protein [Sphingomonadales bacterium]